MAEPGRAPQTGVVFRILKPEDWPEFVIAGLFKGSADDARDGFIHLSTADQVAGTHAKHYGGAAGLLLFGLDTAALGSALRYEPSRGGALFPHLYGPLPLTAIRSVTVMSAANILDGADA